MKYPQSFKFFIIALHVGEVSSKDITRVAILIFVHELQYTCKNSLFMLELLLQ